jgi:hypothetical protein
MSDAPTVLRVPLMDTHAVLLCPFRVGATVVCSEMHGEPTVLCATIADPPAEVDAPTVLSAPMTEQPTVLVSKLRSRRNLA